MRYRALLVGLGGMALLALAGAYMVFAEIMGLDEGLDFDDEDEEFVEAYFAPGLIHGDD